MTWSGVTCSVWLVQCNSLSILTIVMINNTMPVVYSVIHIVIHHSDIPHWYLNYEINFTSTSYTIPKYLHRLLVRWYGMQALRYLCSVLIAVQQHYILQQHFFLIKFFWGSNLWTFRQIVVFFAKCLTMLFKSKHIYFFIKSTIDYWAWVFKTK